MIESLKERRDIETEDARHQHCYRKNDRCGVDSEARVVEERIEHDPNAFTAADDAEAVERYDEEH